MTVGSMMESRPSTVTAAPSQSTALGAIGLMALVAFGLRLAAGMHDLWLDEIWSLFMIDCFVASPFDVVSGSMRHDNNHFLNTLYVACLGPHRAPWLYRMPAVVAGTAAVLVAWLVARQRGPASAWWSGLAFATSYVLVNCSSEARGYGLMCLFLLLAQWAALEAFETLPSVEETGRSIRSVVAFNVASMLGLVSHLTFATGYLALLAWSGWQISRRGGSLVERCQTLVAWHGLPLALLGAMAAGFAKGMTYGGGPPRSLIATAVNGLSALAGGPIGTAGATVTGLFVAVVGICCLVHCWRARPNRGLFFLLSILMAPAFVLAIVPIEHYAIRYLLVPLQTLLLLVAEELPLVIESQRIVGRPLLASMVLAGALVAAAANVARDGVLVGRGRGAYRELLRAVVAASRWPGPTITATSDSHFRNGLLIAYHQENLGGRGIRLLDEQELPHNGAEWYLLLDTRDGMPPRPFVTDAHKNRYAFVGETRGGSLSPGHWQVYRNVHDFGGHQDIRP